MGIIVIIIVVLGIWYFATRTPPLELPETIFAILNI